MNSKLTIQGAARKPGTIFFRHCLLACCFCIVLRREKKVGQKAIPSVFPDVKTAFVAQPWTWFLCPPCVSVRVFSMFFQDRLKSCLRKIRNNFVNIREDISRSVLRRQKILILFCFRVRHYCFCLSRAARFAILCNFSGHPAGT